MMGVNVNFRVRSECTVNILVSVSEAEFERDLLRVRRTNNGWLSGKCRALCCYI